MTKSGKYEFINIVKFIAVILVLNSHYDNLYPISQLATGGALGNGLFFITSGFLLANINNKFGTWYKKRLMRVYLIVYIATAAMIVVVTPIPTETLEWLKILIWPTKFWFVGALIIYYPFYYILAKNHLCKNFKSVSAILLLLYILYYLFLLDTTHWVVEAVGLDSKEGFFKLIYYFYIMLLGAWIRNKSSISHKFKLKVCMVGAIIAVIVMYALKALMDQYNFLMQFQFINQFCVAIFAFYLMLVFMKQEAIFIQWSENQNKLFEFIKFIGNMSLEIYVVQFMVIEKFSNIIFPLNFIVVTTIILILAYILKKFTGLINLKFNNKVMGRNYI